MKHAYGKYAGTFGLVAAAIVLSSCSAGPDAMSSPTATAMDDSSSMEASSPMAKDTPMSSAQPMDMAAKPVGPKCAEYASSMPMDMGSATEMAPSALASMLSKEPDLSTLSKAISGGINPEVDVADTLDQEPVTVFAPVDGAFKALPQGKLDSLGKDSEAMKEFLDYLVVPGRIEPGDLAGKHATVQGDQLAVTGSAGHLQVNDATVLCGGIHASNATIYLVDEVLMPAAKM